MMAPALSACMVMEMRTDPGDIVELARALHTETRLLGDLAETLRRQRAGVSCDDVQAVDESVFGAHRIIRTLGEARRRRRTLVERIIGEQELPLREWDDAFGGLLTPELRDACGRAQDAAETVAREIEINRCVLRTALAASNKLFRALAGGQQQAVAYGADASAAGQPQRGALLFDREV